jgi:ribonuclease HI
MEQLSIFGTSPKKRCQWELFIDGAARNNPGPAGAGIYLLKENIPVLQKGFYLGEKTNNQAEYLALLLGLFLAKNHLQDNDVLLIKSDSQLLVRQLTGQYKIKDLTLCNLFTCAKQLLVGLSYEICHILRDQNRVADNLANHGIDKKIKVPREFMTICSSTPWYD